MKKSEDKSTLVQPLTTIHHICIAVNNPLEKAMEYFSKLGWEFGEPYVIERKQGILRGKPVAYKVREAMTKNVQPPVELCAVLEGRPTQMEFLEAKGECVHHIAFMVNDLEAEIAKWDKQGLGKVVQRGAYESVLIEPTKGAFFVDLIDKKAHEKFRKEVSLPKEAW
jgi:catechol 2,3-dioxygenase-like lactoylglutathione lyase family enzyme